MITKAQEKTLVRGTPLRASANLSTLEKAMLKWVTVDEGDKVLDAGVGCGAMAEYLRRNMMCEVCGVSDSMEDVRTARSRLVNCDIVYATPGDIPWRGGSFDTVLCRVVRDRDTLIRSLAEVRRVLKNGGQLILGLSCLPSAMNRLVGLSAGAEDVQTPDRREVMSMLDSLSFQNVTWQRTGFGTGVVIGWKRKQDLEEILS